MFLAKLQFRYRFNRDNPFIIGNKVRQYVEQRRLPRSRIAGHDDVEPGDNASAQKFSDLGRQGAKANQVFYREHEFAVLPYRDCRAELGNRSRNRMKARTVRETCFDDLVGGVDVMPQRFKNPIKALEPKV